MNGIGLSRLHPDRALAMVALSRATGIPARIVTGFILRDDIDPVAHYWVEVYLDEKWLSYDVQYGYRYELPVTYLPLRRNSDEIVQVSNGELLQMGFSLEREFNHPYLSQIESRSFSNILNLTQLPLNTRDELALLLLLPPGVLISALFRHLVDL